MSDRRLDPAELRARLASNLAESPSRGGAISTMTASTTITPAGPTAGHPIYKAREDRTAEAQTSVETVSPRANTRKEKRRPTEREPRTAIVHRHHDGAVLRGYRIPIALHRQAERAKLTASIARGSTLHWDEVLQDAIDTIPADLREFANLLPQRNGRATPNGPTRVLQATIRSDQEMRLRLLRLDLEELTGNTVRLEDIWTLLIGQSVAKSK